MTDAVPVVDILMLEKRATEALFHDHAVLELSFNLVLAL